MWSTDGLSDPIGIGIEISSASKQDPFGEASHEARAATGRGTGALMRVVNPGRLHAPHCNMEILPILRLAPRLAVALACHQARSVCSIARPTCGTASCRLALCPSCSSDVVLHVHVVPAPLPAGVLHRAVFARARHLAAHRAGRPWGQPFFRRGVVL